MKNCVDCKLDKDESEYHKKKGSKDGLQYRCKSCNKIKARAGYVKGNTAGRAKSYLQKVKDAVNKIKSDVGCCLCKEIDYCCLDFHHVERNEKEHNITRLVSAKSVWKLIEEINKCIVVCSNCHRKIHYHNLDCSKYNKCSVIGADFSSVYTTRKK